MTPLPLAQRTAGWFFQPVALGRVAAMRFLAGAFIWVDWWWYMPWILGHRHVPGELYQPLFLARVLPVFPVPSYWLVVGTLVVLLAASVPMMFNRAPRLFGWICAVAYFEWMIIAMSYGKVDHGKFAFLILLFLLPTMPKARWGDRSTSPSTSAGASTSSRSAWSARTSSPPGPRSATAAGNGSTPRP